jgi:two-component system sensor histidine kinase AgrC
MIETVIGLVRFGFSLLFGVAVSFQFLGMERTRKNRIAFVCSCVILLIVQSACWWFLGIDLTSKLYPLIIHLPLILFFSLYLKRPWLISTVSAISAYLCCQAPRWIGFLAGAAFGNRLADHIVYIAAVVLAYYFLKRYVAGSVRQLMEKSNKSCALLGAVPFFYYMFDYVTTIYTDMLYRGAKWAVQFMPSTISVFYFVFIILYYTETQKQVSAQRERDMLAAQLHQAKTEFTALGQLQECTAVYRHDMRHHFTYLQSLAAEGNIEKVKEYLSAAEQDMDAITPVRFCKNETVNLLLSSFTAKAKQAGILLTVDARLPDLLPFSDTELCSLFSNGLENAITAASASDSVSSVVLVMAKVHRDKLLISMENPYAGQVTMRDGLPVSRCDGHGYGTRSISAIADAHGGQAIFNAEDGVFTLKIMLPLGR